MSVQERIQIVCLFIACILTFLFLEGCRGSSRKQTLILYSPHGKELLSEFEKRYENLYPDIDVQWIDMGSEDAYDRIRTERENPQADLWWGAPSTLFTRAERESLLERYVPSWGHFVNQDYKSSNGYWYATFLTPEVIMYNTRVVKKEDLPKLWNDLLDPKWKGKIIMRYPLASGTLRSVFSSIIAKSLREHQRTDEGFHWLQKLDQNTKTYAADPTQMYLKLVREEGAITIWDLPDVILQSTKNGYPFGYVIPEDGVPMVTDGIAIVKGAKHFEIAKNFYEFVTTKENLILQAKRFYRIPARDDIDPKDLPQWMNEVRAKTVPVDWDLVADHEKEWMQYWDEHIKGKIQLSLP